MDCLYCVDKKSGFINCFRRRSMRWTKKDRDSIWVATIYRTWGRFLNYLVSFPASKENQNKNLIGPSSSSPDAGFPLTDVHTFKISIQVPYFKKFSRILKHVNENDLDNHHLLWWSYPHLLFAPYPPFIFKITFVHHLPEKREKEYRHRIIIREKFPNTRHW